MERAYPPNPLPCGCGAKGTPDIEASDNRVEYRNLHVTFCPLHAAAPDLLEAARQARIVLESLPREGSVEHVLGRAIAKAEGRI